MKQYCLTISIIIFMITIGFSKEKSKVVSTPKIKPPKVSKMIEDARSFIITSYDASKDLKDCPNNNKTNQANFECLVIDWLKQGGIKRAIAMKFVPTLGLQDTKELGLDYDFLIKNLEEINKEMTEKLTANDTFVRDKTQELLIVCNIPDQKTFEKYFRDEGVRDHDAKYITETLLNTDPSSLTSCEAYEKKVCLDEQYYNSTSTLYNDVSDIVSIKQNLGLLTKDITKIDKQIAFLRKLEKDKLWEDGIKALALKIGTYKEEERKEDAKDTSNASLSNYSSDSFVSNSGSLNSLESFFTKEDIGRMTNEEKNVWDDLKKEYKGDMRLIMSNILNMYAYDQLIENKEQVRENKFHANTFCDDGYCSTLLLKENEGREDYTFVNSLSLDQQSLTIRISPEEQSSRYDRVTPYSIDDFTPYARELHDQLEKENDELLEDLRKIINADSD